MPNHPSAAERAEIESFVRAALGKKKSIPPPKKTDLPDPPDAQPTRPAPASGGASHFKEKRP